MARGANKTVNKALHSGGGVESPPTRNSHKIQMLLSFMTYCHTTAISNSTENISPGCFSWLSSEAFDTAHWVGIAPLTKMFSQAELGDFPQIIQLYFTQCQILFYLKKNLSDSYISLLTGSRCMPRLPLKPWLCFIVHYITDRSNVSQSYTTTLWYNPSIYYKQNTYQLPCPQNLILNYASNQIVTLCFPPLY